MIARTKESYTYKTADGVRTKVSYLPEKDYIDKKFEPGMIYFIGSSTSANFCVIQALLEDALWTDRDAFHDEAIKEMKRRIRYESTVRWPEMNTLFAVRIITAKGETITSQYSIPEREHLDIASASDDRISIYLEYLLGELVRSAIRNLSESVIPTLKKWKDSNADLRVPEYLACVQASDMRADGSVNEREIINNRIADIKNTVDGIKDEMIKITSVRTAPAITPGMFESAKKTKEQPEQNGMFSTKKRSWI